MAKLSVTGLDGVLRSLDGMSARLGHMTPALDVISRTLKTHIEERFDTRTAPDGSRWLPVMLNTALYADNERDGLKRSRFATVLYSKVQYGAKASFARVHQEGDGRVPQRAFAPTDADTSGPAEELRAEAKGVLVRYVMRGDVG